MTMPVLEKISLSLSKLTGSEGSLNLPEELWRSFQSAPYDICPGFEGPAGYKWKDARGKDHPRYGRFVYAFAKWAKPELIVEVGTDTGGTAVGWAKALTENGRGKLICVDSDAYSQSTYPQAVQKNIDQLQIPKGTVDLRRGDSKIVVPQLAQQFPNTVGVYLVDGDHTYEGARADLDNGLPMMKPGGYILVHDIDKGRKMNERTTDHPWPVYEAFRDFAEHHQFRWCIFKFIRKHLGVIQVGSH